MNLNMINNETTKNALKDGRNCRTCARMNNIGVHPGIQRPIVNCEATNGLWREAPELVVCSRWKMSIKLKIQKERLHKYNVAKKRKIKKEKAREKKLEQLQENS